MRPIFVALFSVLGLGLGLGLASPAQAQLTFGTRVTGQSTTVTDLSVTGTFRQISRQNIVQPQTGCTTGCTPVVNNIPFLDRTTGGFDLNGNAALRQQTIQTLEGVSFTSGTLPTCTTKCWPTNLPGAAPLNLAPTPVQQTLPNFFGQGGQFQQIQLAR